MTTSWPRRLAGNPVVLTGGLLFIIFLLSHIPHNFFHRLATEDEGSWGFGVGWALTYAASISVIFAVAGGILAKLLASERAIWLSCICLAQIYLFVEFALGGVWVYATSHPTYLEVVATYAPFFAPTVGVLSGAAIVQCKSQR